MSRALRRKRGQVALEVLLVIIPFLMMIVFFFNVMLIMGSKMLTQSTVNRGAQQIASLGCMPDTPNLRSELESKTGLGFVAGSLQFRAVEPDPPVARFDRDQFIGSDGMIRAGAPVRDIPACSDRGGSVVPSGDYIYVQASYRQKIAFADALGFPADIRVANYALVVSNSLEDES